MSRRGLARLAVAASGGSGVLGASTRAKRCGRITGMSLKSATPPASEVLRQALRLDEKDRASVAGALIESLHTEVDPDVESAWDAEIRRRVDELDSGAVKTVPWSEVRERLFRGLE